MKTLHKRFAPLFAAFESAGFELFLVGGCVRDALMGRPSSGDVDFATNALAAQTEAVLEEHRFRSFSIGARFGTIASIVDDTQVEITTYRVAERYAAGSRKPEVDFGDSIVEDLSRRDLSINAMAFGPSGVVLDPFDGQGAIRERRLEVPNGGLKNTISILREDPLRLLRIARFAAQLGFTPTPHTTAAAKETAGTLRHISRERWKMEMDKLLNAPGATQGLLWLAETGALTAILPAAAELIALGQIERVAHSFLGPPASPSIRWAALTFAAHEAHYYGSAVDMSAARASRADLDHIDGFANGIARAFRFSNDERAALRAHCELPFHIAELREPWSDERVRRWLAEAGQYADGQLELLRLLSDDVDDAAQVCERFAQRVGAVRALGDPVPRLPAGMGRRVMQAFDCAKGPVIGLALDALRDAIFRGDVDNGAAAEPYLAYLRETPGPWLESVEVGDEA